MKKQKRPYKKIALILSLCAIVLWSILGTGASLAWFSDSSPEINNIFHFSDFDVTLSYLETDGKWFEVTEDTALFDENAKYEPGYTQVVYLKVKNEGDCNFDFYTAVNVNGCTIATNVFGNRLLLHEYLKFGITVSKTENEMKASVPNRSVAAAIATHNLHNYDPTVAELKPNEERYIALIIRMPEEVSNVANHDGNIVPKLELGVTVKADQIR